MIVSHCTMGLLWGHHCHSVLSVKMAITIIDYEVTRERLGQNMSGKPYPQRYSTQREQRTPSLALSREKTLKLPI